MRVNLHCIAIALLASAVSLAGGEVDAATAFERLKSLAGNWEGRSPMGLTKSTFKVIANGTAIQQEDEMPGHDIMMTVYHLDGGRLLLTHYCSAGNQPRLVAKRFDAGKNEIDFDFLDATGMSGKQAGHIHAAKFRIPGGDHYWTEWMFSGAGKETPETIDFARVK